MFRKMLSLLGDVAVFGLSSALGQILNFLLLPLYTRQLSTSDYGDFAQLQILYLLFAPLANLGMTTALFRFYRATKDETERSALVNTAMASVLGMSLLLLAILAFLTPFLSKFFFGEAVSLGLIQLMLVSAACAAITTIPQSILRCERRVKTTAGFNTFELITTILATIYFVVFCKLKVLGVVLGVLAGDASLMIVLIAATFKLYNLRIDRVLWRKMIAYGGPYTPHHLQAIGLAQFGQYMLYKMLGPSEAGIYNTAAKFAMPLGFTVNAIQSAWVPFKFQIHAEDPDPKSFFRSIVTYYFAGLFYLWLGVSLWGPEMIRWLTPAEYHPAALFVPVAALISASIGVYFMLGTGLELGNDTRMAPLVSFVGLVTVVALAFLFIPQWREYGAAIATAAGWIVMAFVLFRLGQQHYAIRYDWMALVSFAFLAGLMGLISWWGQSHMVWASRLSLAVGFSAAYPPLAFLVLFRSESERHRVVLVWDRLSRRFGAKRVASDSPK